jgi:hypothetical protein
MNNWPQKWPWSADSVPIAIVRIRFRFHYAVLEAISKLRIFVQGQGGSEFSATGILPYFEDWKRGPDTEMGRKDNVEMASMET